MIKYNRNFLIITLISMGLVSLYLLDSHQMVTKTPVRNKVLEALKNQEAHHTPQQLPSPQPAALTSVITVEKESQPVAVKNNIDDWNTRFQRAFKDCFRNETTPDTFTDILALLTPQFKSKELVKSNWHLRLSSGEERRILLSSIDTENSPQRSSLQVMENYEIRQFSVDNEDLPIPLNKTEKYSRAKLKKILNQGEVFFKEEQLNNVTFKNENVFVVIQNGALQSMEWYGKDSSFLCQLNGSCICRL